MRRATSAVLAATCCLALPGVASADVYVRVPTPFLGGAIWAPAPAVSEDPAGRPSLAPRATADLCGDSAPGDCVVVGEEAELDTAPLPRPGPGVIGTPTDGTGVETEPAPDEDTPDADGEGEGAQSLELRAMPVVPPDISRLAADHGGLLHPGPADWLMWQRPTLRWRPVAGAGYYNVQIFRGNRRVLNAWSTRPRFTVPPRVLDQGRSFVWAVWPGSGPRSAGRYGPPVGRSTFAVTLRPRIVFRTPGEGRGTVGQIRPRVPFATIRLTRPRALRNRVPEVVTLDRRGRLVLPISSRAAERLGAVLVDRGPLPPVGLRGPGT